jgi:UDP-glucuronate 4-epimerase
MNFLVTGGAGFIGSHLCERLLGDGHAVWAFDDLNDTYSPTQRQRNLRALDASPRFHLVQGDVRHRAAVEDVVSAARPDQIVHLAGRAGVRPSLGDPVLYQEVNVVGTTHLLEAARSHGVRKIAIASSSSVYGVNSKVPFSERDPIFHPISPYAASKLACEGLGHVYHHVYGMDVVMLRLFSVYGPRQRPDLAICKFVGLIERDQPIPVFGDGSSARDYTYVTDILDGIMAVTRNEFGFEIFNLGGSAPIRLARLIELIEAATGKRATIERQPTQPGDVPITCADIGKAERMLGYHPKTSIQDGLARYVEWFRRHDGGPSGG